MRTQPAYRVNMSRDTNTTVCSQPDVNVQALSTALAAFYLTVTDLSLPLTELPLGVLLNCPVAVAVTGCWLVFVACNSGDRRHLEHEVAYSIT